MTTLYKNTGTEIMVWTIIPIRTGYRTITQRDIHGARVPRDHKVEPKNLGRANETTLEEQIQREIASKIQKQKDKGYVEDYDYAVDNRAVSKAGLPIPMRALPTDKFPLARVDWATAWGQPKLDGHRAVYKRGVGLVSNGGNIINLPEIVEQLDQSLWCNMEVDGELYVHGVHLNTIGKWVRAPHKYPGLVDRIKYHVFDQIADQPFTQRIQRLAHAYKAMKGDPEFDRLVLVPTTPLDSEDDAYALEEKYVRSRFEGLMVRHTDAGYEPGKRSQQIVKVKRFKDAEFKVVDYKEGQSIVKGKRVPIWICESPGKGTFDVTGAGCANTKHYEAVNAQVHMGKMLTVKYFTETVHGLPMYPVALRWREDL